MNSKSKEQNVEEQNVEQKKDGRRKVSKADWDRILARKEEKPPLHGFVYKSSKTITFVPMGRSERWDDNLHG